MNSTRGKRERIGRILRMHANKREELNDVLRGQHLRGRRPRATRAPATRSATRSTPIVLEKMIFPEPVISIAIEPKTKADVEKLGVALQKLAYEDPSFRTYTERGDGRRPSSPAWASSTSRSSSTASARVQGRVERRQARGRVPRGDREEGRRRVQVRQAVRRSRPVRPRAHRDRARRARRGLRLRERHRRRRHPEGVHPVDREGHPRGA